MADDVINLVMIGGGLLLLLGLAVLIGRIEGGARDAGRVQHEREQEDRKC